MILTNHIANARNLHCTKKFRQTLTQHCSSFDAGCLVHVSPPLLVLTVFDISHSAIIRQFKQLRKTYPDIAINAFLTVASCFQPKKM